MRLFTPKTAFNFHSVIVSNQHLLVFDREVTVEEATVLHFDTDTEILAPHLRKSASQNVTDTHAKASRTRPNTRKCSLLTNIALA